MSSWIVFGGEDQRQALMANRQQKRLPRPTTNIVVRNGPAASQAGPSRATQARRRRNRRKPQQTVVRVLSNKNQNRRRNPRSQGLGNRVVVQKIVSTLGTVGANGSGNIETEMAILINPSTMKDTTGSNTYGPLQIYASTYTLYSIRSLKLHLKPLVGNNAVSGTVIRTSWNPTSNPTQTSWSALGARKHSDTTPGRDGRFVLTARELRGPKDGWYKTNTKGEPMMSFAGSLEIHTLGETRSTYQTNKFEGGLFLAELEIVWAFKDYSQQPGLMNLLKGESKGDATISTDQNGKLILTTPATSALSRAARTTTASEIIWMVTDAVVQGAAAAFPTPFGWLLRGGWWFLKRIAGAPIRSGQEQFEIYSSITDARAGVPCLADVPNHPAVSVGQLHFQQITPGNTGIAPDIPQVRELVERFYPTDKVFVPIETRRLKWNTTDQYVPGFDVWYEIQIGNQNFPEGLYFKADGVPRYTYNIMDVTFAEEPDIDKFFSKIPIYMKVENGPEYLVAVAVAKSSSMLRESSAWRVDSFLIYGVKDEGASFSKKWKGAVMRYPLDGTYQARLSIPTESTQGIVRAQVRKGHWYVIQFTSFSDAAYPITREFVCGGEVVGVLPSRPLVTGDHTFPVTGFRGDSSLVPVYGAGIKLTPFLRNEIDVRDVPPTTPQLNPEIENIIHTGETLQIGGQIIYDDCHPAFGYDDALEFPPPPSEEGLACDEEEFEDPEEDEDEELELGPDDDYSDPPISRLVVHPDAQQLYEQLRATFPEREARLAVNQLNPSGEYIEFTTMYHNALVDGLSPRAARAFALGL